MSKIKQSIDEQLEYLVVDEDLKERTLSNIYPNRKRRGLFQMGYVTKGLTLMSTFTLLVVLSINLLLHTDPNQSAGKESIPLRHNPSDNAIQEGLDSFTNPEYTEERHTTEETEEGDNNSESE